MNKKYYFQIGYILSVCLFILASTTVATYAWFTHNNAVATNTLTATSGEEELDLLLSLSETGAYVSTLDIFDKSKITTLMPISTDDLVDFYKPTISTETLQSNFILSSNDHYCQEIFIRANKKGFDTKDSVEIYIDTDGIILTDATNSPVEKALRVGLVFSYSGKKDTYILCFDPILSTEQVVESVNKKIANYVKDPAVLASDYTVKESSGQLTIPKDYLVKIPVNTTCKLEIYCYIEGNDPDCTKDIYDNTLDLQIPFYGVLSGNGGA